MAVNHADGTLFASLLVYPIAAAYAAFGAGARWTAPLFFVAGLATGALIVIASRFVLYSVMGRVLTSKVMQDENGWPAWIVGTPLLIAYLAFPIAITCAGLYMTWLASDWAANTLNSR